MTRSLEALDRLPSSAQRELVAFLKASTALRATLQRDESETEASDKALAFEAWLGVA